MRARPCVRPRPTDAGDPRRSRSTAILLTLCFLVLPLAGCAGDAPDESTPPAGDTGTGDANGTGDAGGDGTDATGGSNGTGDGNETGDDTNDTGDASGSSAFLVEDLRVEDQDGNQTLHEDDRATVRYTLRHPGGSNDPLTRFVSLAIDGEVVKVDQVRLEPGATKEMEYDLGTLRDRESVVVEVRVAPARERMEATVETWPRTRENVEMGPVTLRVNRWLTDLEDGGSTIVNVTLSRQAESTGGAASPSFQRFRANILCADAEGVVSFEGEARPSLPEPGATGLQDIRLPGCDHTLYGVRFTGEVDGETVERRVLFVEDGWRPPAADA